MTADRLFKYIESDVLESIERNAELASPEEFKGRVLLCVEPDHGDPIAAEFKPAGGRVDE